MHPPPEQTSEFRMDAIEFILAFLLPLGYMN
jgi:hypothetical protein